MTDLELLFLVLGIIYLWECGWWAKRGAIGFRSWLGKNWRLAQPSRLLGNQHGGFVFAPPLPPLGTLLTSHGPYLSISPDAVLAYAPPSIDLAGRSPQAGSFFRFEEIQQIVAKGKKVWVNGQLLLKAASPASASYLAEALGKLRQSKPSERTQAIEQELEGAFDTKAIEKCWKEFTVQTSALRLTTNLLFFYLFGVAPVVLWTFGLSQTWPWLLLGMLGCTLSIALQFHRAHKRLYPEAEDERFTHFIIVLLSPASAVRAHDLLARPLLERFHPLAIAGVFCSESAFKDLAAQIARELRHPALPLCPRSEPLAQMSERYARERLETTLEKFLRRRGCELDELLRPPPRSDSACGSFCPRCHAQFTLTQGSCPDCGGVALVRF